jgi:hypothetical protein
MKRISKAELTLLEFQDCPLVCRTNTTTYLNADCAISPRSNTCSSSYSLSQEYPHRATDMHSGSEQELGEYQTKLAKGPGDGGGGVYSVYATLLS